MTSAGGIQPVLYFLIQTASQAPEAGIHTFTRILFQEKQGMSSVSFPLAQFPERVIHQFQDYHVTTIALHVRVEFHP